MTVDSEEPLASGSAWVNGAPMADVPALVVRGIWTLIRQIFRIRALSGRVLVSVTPGALVLTKSPYTWKYQRSEVSGILQRAHSAEWLDVMLRNGDEIALQFPNAGTAGEIVTAWRS